jgi:hypothetical protein
MHISTNNVELNSNKCARYCFMLPCLTSCATVIFSDVWIYIALLMGCMVHILPLHVCDVCQRQLPDTPPNFITTQVQHHSGAIPPRRNTIQTVSQHSQTHCELSVLHYLLVAIYLFHSTIMYSWDNHKDTLYHH